MRYYIVLTLLCLLGSGTYIYHNHHIFHKAEMKAGDCFIELDKYMKKIYRVSLDRKKYILAHVTEYKIAKLVVEHHPGMEDSFSTDYFKTRLVECPSKIIHLDVFPGRLEAVNKQMDNYDNRI